jgi:hypothetical protein
MLRKLQLDNKPLQDNSSKLIFSAMNFKNLHSSSIAFIPVLDYVAIN